VDQISDSTPRHLHSHVGGVANRRRGMGLRLGDIAGSGDGPGGGPSAAGLGAGRPTALDVPFEEPPTRRRDFDTPFSNFGKMMYVSLIFLGKQQIHVCRLLGILLEL
jgi:mitogen-activated protein kinase kinase